MTNLLQDNLNKLLVAASGEAGKHEEDFFRGIEGPLNSLCEAIAKEVCADSAAVFFVTDDNPPGSAPFIVMRGAWGSLHETFEEHVEHWRHWRKGQIEDRGRYSGFAYPSANTNEFRALSDELQQQDIKGWSVTNQVWHLAKGRIANSNRAMDELHGGVARIGRGDSKAYPGSGLYTSFRTMVAVPIFAHGNDGQVVAVQGSQEGDLYPRIASSSSEFLGRYRVIGILKVENKKPECEEVTIGNIEQELEQRLSRDLDVTLQERQEILAWGQKVASQTSVAFEHHGCPYPDVIKNTETLSSDAGRGRQLCKDVADIVTRCCQAEFTRQDTELLVLLAMQVGRLATRRIITHAADLGIVVGENEVGVLNMRWRDVDHLAALGRAAEAATRKLNYHLEALRSELDYERRQMIFRLRVSELLDAQGPIRDVAARHKEFISLFRKLVRKQRLLEENLILERVDFTGFHFDLQGYGIRSGERAKATGLIRFLMDRPQVGEAAVETTARLGTKGGVQATIDDRFVVALHPEKRICAVDSLLVKRILDPHCFAVDDLAGARIITDYESDIGEVLDELRIRLRLWNIDLCKVDDLPSSKEGGYRAVHLTVKVDIGPLLPSADIAMLREALEIRNDHPVLLPAEIQLRTAYQHSWALKTHGTSYKREEQIPEDLTDEQEILSNVLAEADKLSDIVRSNIENTLLPSDYGERRLLAFLSRHCTPADLNIAKFGLACAKEILKDQLRYNGQPEYEFVIEVCERLVYNFGFADSTMLLLALLRNVWRLERGRYESPAIPGSPDPGSNHSTDHIISQLCRRLERKCPAVLAKYRDLLPMEPDLRQQTHWLQTWMAEFPPWFWVMQRTFREYFAQPAEDRTRQVTKRLKAMYWFLQDQGGGSLAERLERAYVMEAAVLMATLTELPYEPGQARRKRQHDEYLSLYREIRKYLPNGPTKTRVVEELESAFREVETQLDLTREPEWWSE